MNYTKRGRADIENRIERSGEDRKRRKEKGMKLDETKKELRVIASFKDFDGDVQKWKNAFYELWRLQMTWSFAYSIEVNESAKGGVFVCLVIRHSYEKQLGEFMDDLGYRNIQTVDTNVGIMSAYWDELREVEELYYEY